jgi:small-conductance mechanosensitive channel
MSGTFGSFLTYVQRVWLGNLPGELIRAILVAAVFEGLVYVVRVWILRRLRPVLLRDAGAPAPVRVQRRRKLLSVPLILSRGVLYVIAILMILRIFRLQTSAELLPVGLALVAAVLVLGWRPLRDLTHGYLILYDNLYTRGERVRRGAHEGTVEEVQLRWTHLVTDEGVPVFIPNSQVGEIVNLSRQQPLPSPATAASASPPAEE